MINFIFFIKKYKFKYVKTHSNFLEAGHGATPDMINESGTLTIRAKEIRNTAPPFA